MKPAGTTTTPPAGKNISKRHVENATSSSAWRMISRGKGNGTQTLAGGDQNGANQRPASYTANDLNEITSRQYPGTNDVIGVALATNSVITPYGPPYQLAFTYDAQSRRIQKVVTNGAGVTTNRFVYDGWNVIVASNVESAILETFVWDSDLSGTPQRAGGVGGLLEVSYRGAATTNCFTAFDGNGNVAALINAANGTVVANYEYGPGEVIRATGPMAKANPIRFSTKYQDDESDFLYYGFRYYKPSIGSWLSRDPLPEQGFKSRYGNLIRKKK